MRNIKNEKEFAPVTYYITFITKRYNIYFSLKNFRSLSGRFYFNIKVANLYGCQRFNLIFIKLI